MRWVRLEMAKKGRVARILTTLHRVAGTPVSEALKRRQRSAVQRGDAGTHSGSVSKWRKRKDRERRREQFEGAAKETGLPHGYHSGMRVLLVGEGNLSFALALITLFDGDGSNLLVTSLDRQRVARAAYPYCEDVEESIEASGAAVVFDVDVEEPDALRRVAKDWWKAGDVQTDGDRAGACVGPGGHFKGFHRIVFNFPDRGVGTSGPLSVKANQDMLGSFFDAAKGLLTRGGEVHVATQGDDRTAAWNVVGVAARHGLVYRASLGFEPGTFPGYEHYRTLPHESLWGHHRGDDDEERDDAGDEGRVEANDDDVAEGAQTMVFQVDDTPKGAKDAELIRKGKTLSLK